MASTVDVATGATIATANDDAIGAVVPLSSTKDKDAYVGMSVAFEGVCTGAFADGADKSMAGEGGGGGSSVLWGTRTVVAPVDLIVAGDAIVVAIVSFRRSPPLPLVSAATAAAAPLSNPVHP